MPIHPRPHRGLPRCRHNTHLLPLPRLSAWWLACAAALSVGGSYADDTDAPPELEEVIVTAPRMAEPLVVKTDPKAPQQPVPANDGASYLKNIPGFNVIRKGGTDGDPVLRGLAGSRLNVLVDGSELLGGCGMRMDPPTAYVFPEAYDAVTVIKGPQSVRYGNGNLAGVVLFDRDPQRQREPGLHGSASALAGAWGRHDALAELRAAGRSFYTQASASFAESDDYEDGAGRKVHSAYERKSLSGAGGWTPDADTRVEVSVVGSAAEAAYADRAMDGSKFDRLGYGLRFEKENLGAVLKKLSAQAYRNDIDHVMDNYSLRTRTAAMYMASNPDRETEGLRLSGDLAVTAQSLLTVGADWQRNIHTLRKYSSDTAKDIDDYRRARDMDASMLGLYAELRHELSERARLIGGLRYDGYAADRHANRYGGVDASADETLKSGFLRYERMIADTPLLAFIGLGHAERPYDYWEASTYAALTPTTRLDPEKNTQLDTGMIWQSQTLKTSVSLFYGEIADYILTGSTALGASCPGSQTSCADNVDVSRWGGEADFAWRFATRWTTRGNLAYVHADNDTMHTALAQTPPLEGRLGVDYSRGSWTFAGVLRMVAEQDRFHAGYGNVVGQDLGGSAGFSTLAVNASYQPSAKLLISAGIDNAFDHTYAEHLSRNGAAVAGYATETRVYEPGRFAWLRLRRSFN